MTAATVTAASDQVVVVKTTENTNTPADLRKIDRSWGWRRLMYFSVIFSCLAGLGWIVFHRPISDPIVLLYVRYSFWTMWIGLLMYGSQGTMSELADVIAAFMSGKRVVETSAPPPATVTTTAAGGSRVTGGETATVKVEAKPAPEVPPWQR